jgi:hypothetical protein
VSALTHLPAFLHGQVARAVARASAALLLFGAWSTFMWFQPARRWPVVGVVRGTFRELAAGWGLGDHYAWAARVAVFTPLGILLASLLVWRPPRAFILHGGAPPTAMRRLLGLALIVALPFQIALGAAPGMHHFYRRFFEDQALSHLMANALTIAAEHLWIEGAMLGLALPVGLLVATPVDEPRVGRLARFGLGFPERAAAASQRTVSAWLGVPPLAWPAILAQGLLFFLIHVHKHPGELATSLPGGIAVGWLTLRTRSFVPAMVLHFVTGGVVLLTMTLTR